MRFVPVVAQTAFRATEYSRILGVGSTQNGKMRTLFALPGRMRRPWRGVSRARSAKAAQPPPCRLA